MTEVVRNGSRILRDPQGQLVEVDPSKADHLLSVGVGGKKFSEVTEADVTRQDIEATNSTLGAKVETFGRSAADSLGDVARLGQYTPSGFLAQQASKAAGLELRHDQSLPAQAVGMLGGDAAAYEARSRELAQTNPGSQMLGQVAGTLLPAVVTGGVTSAAAAGLGARMGGGALARAGGAALAYGAEGAAYGAAGAETAAREAGQTEGATAEQLLWGIGLGGVLGGGIGAASSATSSLFRRIASAEQRAAAPEVAQRAAANRAAITGTAEDSLARLQSNLTGNEYETLAKYGAHKMDDAAIEGRRLWKNRDKLIDEKVAPIAKDVQTLNDAFAPVTEIVRNPNIRKNIVDSLPDSMKPAARVAGRQAIGETLDAARVMLSELPENAYTKSTRASLQRFVDYGDSVASKMKGTANDANAAANAIKQEAQRVKMSLTDTAISPAANGELKRYAREAAQRFESEAQEPLRQHLMDPKIWGEAGVAQQAINGKWETLLKRFDRYKQELFAQGPKDYHTGQRQLFADTAKVKSWLSTAGTTAGETRQTMVRETIDAIDDLASTIGKYHEMGPGQAKQLEALQGAAARMRSAIGDVDKTVSIANKIDDVMAMDKRGIGQLVTPGALAATGAILGGPLGAAAGLGIGMLARPGAAIGAAEAIQSVAGRFGVKLQNGTSNWILSAAGLRKAATRVGQAATGTAVAATTTARAAIPTTVASFVGREKSLDKAYEKRIEQLVQAKQDPSILIDNLAKATGNLSEVNPNLAGALIQKASAAIDFLASRAPAGTIDPTMLQPGRKSVVSDLEKKRFARLWMAVEKPETVLNDLRRGMATPDQLEALRVVHPETYQAIRMTVMDAIAEVDRKGARLPLAVRTQLDLLLDLDGAGVPALGPEIAQRISGLQQAKQQKQPQQNKVPNLTKSMKLTQQGWPSVGA